MNMERSIPNNDAQNPESPKKRLHTKDKSSLTDSIASARASLKNGKDISARNLLDCAPVRKPLARQASLEFDADLAKDASESSADEIVALDDEHTDFTSACAADGFNGYVDDDDDDTIEEEIIEEYYEEEVIDDASLESLPPPIVIPKSLQVKDSDSDDEEEDDDDDDCSDDDTDTYDDDDDSNPVVVAQPITKQQQRPNSVSSTPTKPNLPVYNVSKTEKAAKPLNKVTSVETETPKSSTSPMVPVAPPMEASNIASVQTEQTKSNVASTIDVDEEIDRKVASCDSQANEDSATTGSVWEKPDWTKNNRLKSTGISPARNLAKPITQLPELVSKKEMNDIKTPKKSNTMQSKLSLDNTKAASIMTYPKSPAKSIAKKVSMPSISAPKSAPQQDGGRPKVQVSTPVPTAKDDNDDDFGPKIGWEKPEWATKKVLRKTAKTETILSGGKLERPIGGIRPIE